ncbi:MAG: DUF5618 family protein [Chitinispirillales bacterium]|jgi:hypothetical protein|nr:DUF5618 family protein [Chitinispirillales bacterium]
MTIHEQNIFLIKEYEEAVRYMNNANEALQKSKKDDRYYSDKKYVRTACGVAYSGVLLALDAWLTLKGIPKPNKKQRKSIEYYMSNITELDKKLLSNLHTVYNILHLAGYYDGVTNIKVIQAGFESANEIIEKIKPERAA